MSVYTSTDEPPPELLRALGRLMRVVGLETVETSDVERGSWHRRWRLRHTKDEGLRRLTALATKAQRAGELHVVQQVRAQADEHEANAVASVIRALDGVDSAVVQLSSVVIVKHQSGLVCRVLSEREISILADHPELLKAPAELCQLLSTMVERRRGARFDDGGPITGEKATPPVIGL
jgi:hypothetical protein